MSNVVEVEVSLTRRSNMDHSLCEQLLSPELRKLEYVPNGTQIRLEGVEELKNHVEYVMVCGDNSLTTHLPSVNIKFW